MYARHVVFGEDRRAFEEGRFCFQDALHAAEALYPFDSFVFEYASITPRLPYPKELPVSSPIWLEHRVAALLGHG
jgi:hypothetical protein